MEKLSGTKKTKEVYWRREQKMDILKRVGAIALVVILVGMYVATFIMGIMGSEHVMAMVFLDVVVPVLCWGVWLIARVLRRKGEEMRSGDDK